MSKRKKRRNVPKSGPVWQRTAEQATLDRMPKYNGHICATGVQGDTKYNRAEQKKDWQRQLRQEGARTRGSLPFFPAFYRNEIGPNACYTFFAHSAAPNSVEIDVWENPTALSLATRVPFAESSLEDALPRGFGR